jgi:hypothetical protein
LEVGSGSALKLADRAKKVGSVALGRAAEADRKKVEREVE